jgi:TRAP-type C4-dicarboxylate transport system substrate-binding protein
MKLASKIIIPVLLLVTLLISSAPAGAQPSPTTSAAPQAIVWKGQDSYPPAVPYGPFNADLAGLQSMHKMWSQWLSDLSGGRVQIRWSDPGAIFPIGDADKAVAAGTVDIAMSSGLYFRGRFPEGDIEGGGVFFLNDEQLYDLYYNWGLYEALRKLYAEKLNLVYFPVFANSLTGIGVNFDAPNLDSLKGKKIRAVGVQGDWMAALGASPTIIPLGDTYQALKLGTVDGWVAGAALLEANKWNEVTKGWVQNPICSTVPSAIIINQKSFNALPADIRDLIQKTNRYMSFATSTRWGNQNYYARLNAKKKGVKFWEWSEADQQKAIQLAVTNVWPKMRAASPDCAKLMDMVEAQAKAWGLPTAAK